MQNHYMQNVKGDKHLRMDPRTKIFILIILNISVFTANEWYVMGLAAFITSSIFIVSRRYILGVSFAFAYGIALLFYSFFIDTSSVIINNVAGILSGIVCRMGPGLLMGYYLIITTTVSEFIASMERLRIPKKIIIPFSVIFRFLPTINEEMHFINDAMRMRGISIGKAKGNVIKLLEYRLVPLFISCIKIGEELSCSALTRGLGSGVKRSNICTIGIKTIDGIYILLGSITILLHIIAKGG